MPVVDNFSRIYQRGLTRLALYIIETAKYHKISVTVVFQSSKCQLTYIIGK